jgi:host factor-I protein
MTSPLSSRRRSKAPPPGDTGQEALYLRSLSDRQVVVTVKLRDGEQVRGWIEYFDDSMLRLTREGAPNLFIYKSQIRSIAEASKRREPRAGGAAAKAISNSAVSNGADSNGAGL